MSAKRMALALAGVALVAASATACGDDGPPCVESYTAWHFIPVYNGKTTTQVWTPYQVCTRYADPSPSAS